MLLRMISLRCSVGLICLCSLVIRNLATDEIILKSRRAAWRERKATQRMDIQKGTMEADKADESGATEDELEKTRNDNKSAMTKDRFTENKGKKMRAEFY